MLEVLHSLNGVFPTVAEPGQFRITELLKYYLAALNLETLSHKLPCGPVQPPNQPLIASLSTTMHCVSDTQHRVQATPSAITHTCPRKHVLTPF